MLTVLLSTGVIGGADWEPLTLVDAKRQLGVVGSHDDVLIADAITDARGWIENYTGLILMRRQVVEIRPSFNTTLSAWPIVSIDSVHAYDADEQEVAMASGDVIAQIVKRPARITVKPSVAFQTGDLVKVTMTAGFTSASDINAFSPNIMRALRILVAGFYRDREVLAPEVEDSAKRLCRNFRRWQV